MVLPLVVHVRVSSREDPDLVEELLLDEATKAMGEVDGLLPEPAPFVGYDSGDASTRAFQLTSSLAGLIHEHASYHELLKRILRRLRLEGILTVPGPARSGSVEMFRISRPDPGTAPRDQAIP